MFLGLPPIQRDPEVSQIVSRVHQQLAELVAPFEPEPKPAPNEVMFVSFEDAIKELSLMKAV